MQPDTTEEKWRDNRAATLNFAIDPSSGIEVVCFEIIVRYQCALAMLNLIRMSNLDLD